jgi:hypothetical protein
MDGHPSNFGARFWITDSGRLITMLSIFNVLSRLLTPSPTELQDRDEKYLSEAVDIYDLENRMRQLDRDRRERAALGPYGVALR